jgi:hypothetical protein
MTIPSATKETMRAIARPMFPFLDFRNFIVGQLSSLE